MPSPAPDYISRDEKPRRVGGFPWLSALCLLYPIGAMAYVAMYTPASITTILGYGFAQLGYLLVAAGIFVGTFRVFGLRKRWQILLLGLISFCIGTALSNV